MVQRTFNSAYTRNSLIIFFRSVTSLQFLPIADIFTLCSVTNDGVLSFDQLLSLNFKRRELRYGNRTRKIEVGLSNEEYAEIWMDLVGWVQDVLSPGAYIQWIHVQQEFKTWYMRAIGAWRHGKLGGDAVTG